MGERNLISKHLPKLVLQEIRTNQIFYVPMLAKRFTLKESSFYDNSKLDFRPKFKEPVTKCSTGTCYSIDRATFDEKNMV